MKKVLILISALFFSLVLIEPASADIEFGRGLLEKVGNNHPEFQKKVTEGKAFISKTKQLATRISKTVEKVKKTVKQAEGTVKGVIAEGQKGLKMIKSTADKIQNVMSAAKDTANSIKQGKVPTNLPITEFKELASISSGDPSEPDDKKAEKTKEFFLKQPEKDDIEYQQQKEKAVNERNANQSADQYSESLVLRQEIASEEDDPQTPETIDEAQSLIQEVAQKSFKRNNRILRMRAMQLDYQATNALMGLNKQKSEKTEDKKDEN